LAMNTNKENVLEEVRFFNQDDDNPERHRHATRRVAAIKLFRTRELIIETVGSSDSENEKIKHE
nr:hypothetical protein [Tanacetum cinerariifolium]